VTGPQAAVGGPGRADAVRLSFARRQQFEAAHPDVAILTPRGILDRWRAVLPAAAITADGTTTLGSQDLAGLMDQLEEIYPPDGTAV